MPGVLKSYESQTYQNLVSVPVYVEHIIATNSSPLPPWGGGPGTKVAIRGTALPCLALHTTVEHDSRKSLEQKQKGKEREKEKKMPHDGRSKPAMGRKRNQSRVYGGRV